MDDLEATYRTKGTGHYKGYVANITETCDPENEIQLITKVQVAPNNVDDGQLLAEALPNLKERTHVDTLVTDGGYGGEVSDEALQKQEVALIQTAIRGAQPAADKFSLSDFVIQQDDKGDPATLTCPQGHTVPVLPGRTTGWRYSGWRSGSGTFQWSDPFGRLRVNSILPIANVNQIGGGIHESAKIAKGEVASSV